ncbi:MAG TPA: tail fiber protein [Candidatus Limnocylindria bacterium]|jgi:microcystin-dependent protein|nr:tail fiber protein [Candidatus Limnocylindria bacterium]
MADPFLGEIKMVPYNFAPKGWAGCDGQLMPINQNQALFSLLGTTYGGDGRVTFALPDLRGSVPIHATDTYPLGQSGGETSHTLLVSEIPAHTHTLGAVRSDANLRNPSGNLLAFTEEDTYSQVGDLVAMHPASIGRAGAGAQHTNMQPYLVVNFVIALQGIFPSRN